MGLEKADFALGPFLIWDAYGHEQELEEHTANQFSIEFGQDALGAPGTAGFQPGITLPQLEQEFNLPAYPIQQDHLVEGEAWDGHIGDKQAPGQQVQVLRAQHLVMQASVLDSSGPPMGHRFGWSAHPDQTARQAMALAATQQHGSIDAVLGFDAQPDDQIDALARGAEQRGGVVIAAEKVSLGTHDCCEGIQTKIAQIRQD